jgi:hypothetical protein
LSGKWYLGKTPTSPVLVLIGPARSSEIAHCAFAPNCAGHRPLAKRLRQMRAEGDGDGRLVRGRRLAYRERCFDGLDERDHLLRQLDAGGSHAKNRFENLQEVHLRFLSELVVSDLAERTVAGGRGAEATTTASRVALPYGEV